MRFLIAESETSEDREKRRDSTGRSSGESYAATLQDLVRGAYCEIIRPIETGGREKAAAALSEYDAVFLTGSPMHVYHDTPEVRRQLAFMRAVFEAGTPSFGSCAGLQIAAAAAGGVVRENKQGHEVGFARRIVRTGAGDQHPLLTGRPAVFDAAAIHADEVAELPGDGAALLASNEVTAIQAAEIRMGPGVFWGVQYHPELSLEEIGRALRRQREEVVSQGLARDGAEVDAYAVLLEDLDRDPGRRDLAWRLGVNEQVTDKRLRQTELRNFITHLVQPTRSRRGRA